MIKKVTISILLALFLVGNVYPAAEAKSPNVKDCIEDNQDCAEPKTNQIDSEQNGEEMPSNSNPSLFLSFVKMISALLLVLALIYLLLKVLKSRQTLQKQKSLQNLGGISVGPSKSIQFIKVGSKYFLIGVGDNVDLLMEISDQELIDEITAETKKNDDIPFHKFVTSLTKKKDSVENSLEAKKEKEFKDLFSKELTNLKENRKKLKQQNNIRKDNNE